MATIEKLHKNGETIYPETKAEAVLDEDDTSVQTRINEGVFFKDPEEAHSSAYVDTSSIVDGAVTKQKIAWSAILNYIYPIGSIYMSATLSTPTQVKNALGGGTWEAWGSGRVPVGVDTTQTEFDTVGKTGGAKTHTLTTAQMPSHKHGVGYVNSAGNYVPSGSTALLSFRNTSSVYSPYINGVLTDISPTGYTNDNFIQNTGSGSAHNNLQPYITCYMYRRTA